ncbi:metal ABC transporter permease [Rhodoplanes sp. TEM]|uniref:Metal ABC transporter permease n=1 Tax=Rhodoplanes tepidamans TaxID=200616 RepID=A0ABT5JH19_RHOTP|nr:MULTISPECIES: metal ABC transporter permease [Rhodoplanes]MDC7789001.1 metal ABC transporter permease [Rhodoplanes tepidamans]MDC7986393.1 metal ABC transporter permease [Rhodoplanes sp. TEM]MDQ0355714.1 zinc transport system permease protein [Rhodoplanes tepidamans]
MSADTLAAVLGLAVVHRAIAALLITGVAMPVVGVFIIGLDVVTMRFAMMHVALLGVAVGLMTGFDPTACAVLLCAAAGASLAPFAGRRDGLSGPMVMLMTMAIAAALLVLSISGVNAAGAFELLWGSLLAVGMRELVLVAVLAVAVLAIYLGFRRPLALLLFDIELARCSGVRVEALATLLLVTVAVAVAAALPLTGALLVDAVTLLPALSARNLARSFDGMVGLSMVFGLVGNSVGFVIALLVDLPLGPILVLTAGAITLLTFVVGRKR